MSFAHPLDFIPNSARKRIFLALLAGTLILFAVFRVLDTPLRTSAAPNGIVSFELAGTPEKAFQILVSWESESNQVPAAEDQNRKLYAAFGLGLDYLFMPVYASALALGILLAAGRHQGWFNRVTGWLGWGAYIAAMFDALENFSLWKILLGDVFSTWPAIAAVCASVKFGLLILGLFYAMAGWLWPKKM